MNRSITREQRQRLKTENKRWPKTLKSIPSNEWPDINQNFLVQRIGVWRSRDFLVQVFIEGAFIRLSANRTEMLANGRWSDQITWDEMQEIKKQCGFADSLAIEVYPKESDVVNVASMRHLWIPTGTFPKVGWSKSMKNGI